MNGDELITYQNGETDIDAGDNCNTCTCNDGTLDCTKDTCTECYYDFNDGEDEDEEDLVRYESGETWKDDCNDCSCENKVYYCTQKECGASCTDENGTEHKHGDSWEEKAGCSTCTCEHGVTSCEDVADCEYCLIDGKYYADGDSWYEDCYDCYCVEGEKTCSDTCECTTNSDCDEANGYYCDKPTCGDVTGACFQCTEDNGCLKTPVCSCDDQTYTNSIEATKAGKIIRSYGPCPACSPACTGGLTCCDGCYGAKVCAKLTGYGQCPEPVCGKKYY